MRSVKLLVFGACRALGLFRLARWWTRHRLKILCYHGFELADEARFRDGLFITAATFEQRLAAVRRYGMSVLTLDEAVERLYAGTLPANSTVITVDDGFESFHTLALPRLKTFGYQSTVYVTTYYVDHSTPIFRLVVQYMFWKTRASTVAIAGVPWCADQTVDLRDPAARERAAWQCIDYGEQRCTEEQRVAISEQLGALLGTPYREIVASKMFHLMTPEQLRTLAAAGAAIELHTHRHRFPSDSAMAAEREIADNRAALERYGTPPSGHFCYPSGIFDERQWPWLEAMQVKSSTTCLPGLNSAETPRHGLRRFLDGENIHQLEFEAALTGFSDLLRPRSV